MQTMRHASEGSTLALKSKAEIQNRGISGPIKKIMFHQMQKITVESIVNYELFSKRRMSALSFWSIKNCNGEIKHRIHGKLIAHLITITSPFY